MPPYEFLKQNRFCFFISLTRFIIACHSLSVVNRFLYKKYNGIVLGDKKISSGEFLPRGYLCALYVLLFIVYSFSSSASISSLCKISETILVSSILEIPKHFFPASLTDAPIWYAVVSSTIRNLS